MNFALVPYTSVGYDVQTEEVSMNGDSTLNVFQGTGGTTKFMWGNGIRYGNFSAGLNITYLFGQIESQRQVFFRNLGPGFYDNFEDNISIRALQFSLGFPMSSKSTN